MKNLFFKSLLFLSSFAISNHVYACVRGEPIISLGKNLASSPAQTTMMQGVEVPIGGSDSKTGFNPYIYVQNLDSQDCSPRVFDITLLEAPAGWDMRQITKTFSVAPGKSTFQFTGHWLAHKDTEDGIYSFGLILKDNVDIDLELKDDWLHSQEVRNMYEAMTPAPNATIPVKGSAKFAYESDRRDLQVYITVADATSHIMLGKNECFNKPSCGVNIKSGDLPPGEYSVQVKVNGSAKSKHSISHNYSFIYTKE